MRTDGSLRVLNLAGIGSFFFNSDFYNYFPQKPGIANSSIVIYLKNWNQWVLPKSNTHLGNTGDNMAANLFLFFVFLFFFLGLPYNPSLIYFWLIPQLSFPTIWMEIQKYNNPYLLLHWKETFPVTIYIIIMIIIYTYIQNTYITCKEPPGFWSLVIWLFPLNFENCGYISEPILW